MYVDNEITKLEKVIIHHPNEGISRISPKRAENLLFDDIVFYPLMSEEYRTFHDLLCAFVGRKNVWAVEDLLTTAIEKSDDIQKEIIDHIIDFEELPPSFKSYMTDLSPDAFSKLLITGYHQAEDRILFDPLPNYIFTRDIAVTIHDHILVTKAAKTARLRENLLSRFIFTHHPAFSEMWKNGRIIDLNDLELFPPSRKAEIVSAEGGDIMMFDPKHLLIGCSERTSAYAIQKIRDHLFSLGIIENIVQINIPHERSFMHIDTIFTRIDHDLTACYKPIVYDGEGSNVVVYRHDGTKKIYASIKEFILQEINPNMKFIFSGRGQSPYQEREQWTDSCNLVAVKPGVAISYDRNVQTLQAFEEAGYAIREARELLNHHQTDPHYLEHIQKTIITIPSAELSRARGGSHCMTCPIQRIAL